MKIFAERLKELRVSHKFTLKETAAYCGLTQNAISNYEANTREPSLEVLKSLCDLFNVPADYLIGRIDY